MSRHAPEAAKLTRSSWTFPAPPERRIMTWGPSSLPGSDLDELRRRRPRRPARRPLRRGRIQLVAA